MITENIKKEMKDLEEIINKVFSVEIVSNIRKRDYVYGRMIFSSIMKDRGHRLELIGGHIKKDHSTITYYNKIISHLFDQDPILMSKYLECKKCFNDGREPGVYLTTENSMKTKLIKLQADLDAALLDKQKLLAEQEKIKRLNRIIKLINFNTPSGHEDDVEKKIQRMFNLI
jgi:hypothetical protein